MYQIKWRDVTNGDSLVIGQTMRVKEGVWREWCLSEGVTHYYFVPKPITKLSKTILGIKVQLSFPVNYWWGIQDLEEMEMDESDDIRKILGCYISESTVEGARRYVEGAKAERAQLEGEAQFWRYELRALEYLMKSFEFGPGNDLALRFQGKEYENYSSLATAIGWRG